MLVGFHQLLEPHRTQVAVLVCHGHERVHAFGQPDSFLEGFDDLLVVLSIGGRVIDALAVEQRDAAPAIDQRLKVRLFAGHRGPLAFFANLASVP